MIDYVAKYWAAIAFILYFLITSKNGLVGYKDKVDYTNGLLAILCAAILAIMSKYIFG